MGIEHAHDHADVAIAETPAPALVAPAPRAPVPMPPIGRPAALTVGHASDAAEADADRRADQALGRLAPLPAIARRSATPTGGGAIGLAGGALDARSSAQIESRRGGGHPLASGVRRRMETAFGTSFSRVRVHSDDGAARLSAAMSAAAFTTGQDIYFGAGQLAPDTPQGERVLAHELAHTLQGAGPISRYIVLASHRQYDGSTWADQDYYRKELAAYRDDPLAWAILKWMNETRHATYTYADIADFKKEFGFIMRDVSRAAAGNKARWHIGPFTSPDSDVLGWLSPETLRPKNADAAGTRVNKLIVQSPQERGDMHDVRPAMQIDPTLHVLVHVADPRQLGDAATIVDYYRDMGTRVFVVAGRAVPAAYTGYAWAASSTTETLLKEAKKGPINAGLKNAATGGASKLFAKVYDDVLVGTFNFKRTMSGQTAFALINFRTSGHGVAEPRLPSHPELDTGAEAFLQIWDAVRELGYWPVPTGGDIPANALARCEVQKGVRFDEKTHPHFLDYFKKVGPVEAALKAMPDAPNLSKRQLEYGLIARIKEIFPNTRAVGMRSGGLDAIAQAGVPVLSIDVASSHVKGGDALSPEHGHVNSWMRAAKRELIQPGVFHQVFMSELRDLGKLSEKSWDGTLSASDVTRIAFAMDTFFGSGTKAGTKQEALAEQPLPVTLDKIPDENNRNLFRKLAKLRPGKGIVLDKQMQNALGVVPLGGKDLREPPKPLGEKDEAVIAPEKDAVVIAPEKVVASTPVLTPSKSVGTPEKVGTTTTVKKDVVGAGRPAPVTIPGSTKPKQPPVPTGTPARTDSVAKPPTTGATQKKKKNKNKNKKKNKQGGAKKAH